jgi:hypothetical protein
MHKIPVTFSVGSIACPVSNSILVKQVGNMKRELRTFYFSETTIKTLRNMRYIMDML